MGEMPERIWAERCPNSGDEWWTEAPTFLGLEWLTEYIRADLHQAALDRADAMLCNATSSAMPRWAKQRAKV